MDPIRAALKAAQRARSTLAPAPRPAGVYWLVVVALRLINRDPLVRVVRTRQTVQRILFSTYNGQVAVYEA